MRTHGRITNADGSKTWVVVTTDSSGFNDMVYLTTLAQVLKLNQGESPFWANYGIPAKNSVMQQIFPDYYVSRTQQQFAPNFASLVVAKQNISTPTYNISVITHQGVKLNLAVPVPT